MANAILLKPLAIAAAAANSTALGAPGYIGNDYAGVVYRSGVTGTVLVTIDLGFDQSWDTIMLFGVNGTPSSATVTVFASSAAYYAAHGGFSPAEWNGPSASLYAGTAAMSSGKGVTYISAVGSPPPASRYILLSINLASGYVEIARAVVGKALQPVRNFGYGAGFGVKDLGSLDFSRRGVLLRTRGAKLRTAALTLSCIRKDEAEASFRPLLDYLGNTEMFAMLFDPTTDAQRQNRATFGPLVGDVGLKWRNASAWEAALNQVSIF